MSAERKSEELEDASARREGIGREEGPEPAVHTLPDARADVRADVRSEARPNLYAVLASEDDHDEAEEADDEKWLVSYADMMTLLFGLFVMLYALAMEHKGDIDGVVKNISKSGAGPAAGTTTRPGPPASPREQELMAQVAALQSAKAETESNMRSLNGLVNAQKSQVARLRAELEKAQAEIDAKSDKAASRLASGDSAGAEVLAALARERRERSKEKEQLSRALESAIREKDATASAIADLDAKMKSLASENEKLQSRLNEETASFMMVVLKWSTEKHDLDLKVRDPKGKEYDFDRRRFKGSQGTLLLDSRTGPGVELWQTPKLEPGEYSLTVRFYNDYGNAVPAEFEASVVTKRGVFRMTDVSTKLSLSKGRRLLKFKAAADGEITPIRSSR